MSVADRPIQHNGDVAQYLADLGVKQVTAQDLNPNLQASLSVGAAPGPVFTHHFRAYYTSQLGAGGSFQLLFIEAGPRGSEMLYMNTANTTDRLLIGPTDEIRPVAAGAELPSLWKTSERTPQSARATVQIGGTQPTGIPAGAAFGTNTSVSSYFNFPIPIPPGFSFLFSCLEANQLEVTTILRDA